MKAPNSLIATEYQIRGEYDGMVLQSTTFRRMNSPFYEGERWAVRNGSYCLNADNEWEYEPTPSSRDDAFYDRCRFRSLDYAVAHYNGAMAEGNLP